MEQENKQPLLSICIPTYNRAKYLNQTLKEIVRQAHDINRPDLLEIYVSDNCSSDDTPSIIKKCQESYPLVYNRNKKNIGPDGNFVNCFQKARGKYIWLLGDDDLIEDNAVNVIIHIAQNSNYGLIHINCSNKRDKNKKIDDRNAFLSNISFWITFMSANIIRSEVVKKLQITDELLHSYMLQVPFFLTSATSFPSNYIVYSRIISKSLASSTNGGYNLFKVFVQNHLGFWKQFAEEGKISWNCYENVKEDTYKHFLYNYVYQLLFLHRNIMKKNKRKGIKGGFVIDNAWTILFKTYNRDSYFWISLLMLPLKFIKEIAKKLLKVILK